MLSFNFMIKKGGAEEPVQFSTVAYKVDTAGLIQVGASQKACNISTWTADCFNVPVGFTKEIKFLDSFAEEKKNEGLNTLRNTMLGGGTMLLPEIRMEVEVRDSDFMTMATA
jgi:hypothetical protein